jgi:DNA-binding FadR family transcriptional regulator
MVSEATNWVYRQFASAIRAALIASFRLTNRASQSHEQAIQKHTMLLEAIRDPAAAGKAMETLIDIARAEITEALKNSKKG